MIRLDSLTVRIYGERGGSMEQRGAEVSDIRLPAFTWKRDRLGEALASPHTRSKRVRGLGGGSGCNKCAAC